MTVSSSSFFNPYSSLSTTNNGTNGSKQSILPSYDDVLAFSTNYPTPKQETASSVSSTNKAKNQNQATQSSIVEQFVYAPNISAMFNAYLEKQKLNGSMEGKKDEIAQRLSDTGLDKKLADAYAQNSIDMYKRAMEGQLQSKINEQVDQLREYKQRLSESNSANPYLQMAGSLVNLYS